ncbi:hypothetical protein ACH5RR_004155 [Cinchona calisaya]|uniref:RNA-dependent RNA polymerase n=1 Tax=Cinchona calisaya TaxID=153742 RepID=A0ABD3AWS9_9GENT
MDDHHHHQNQSPLPLQLQFPLPQKVEEMLRRICTEKHHDPPDALTRQRLAEAGEQVALDVVRKIYNTPKTIRTLNGYIHHLIKNSSNSATPSPTPSQTTLHQHFSSLKRPRPTPSSASASPVSPSAQNGESSRHQMVEHDMASPSSSDLTMAKPSKISRQLHFPSEPENSARTTPQTFSYQRKLLSRNLKYQKLFLIYSYIGRRNLEDVVSNEDADKILEMKDLPMCDFESHIWNAYGKQYAPDDRRQSTEWDSGKTHLYYCSVYQDGTYSFKGPYFESATTHLQRTLGDDRVLIVKFVEDGRCSIDRIFKEGILVGLRRYHFFVFKDESKSVKKKKTTEKNKTPFCSGVRCYFVNFDSIAARGNSESYILRPSQIQEVRCHFMHVHMVSSLAKYMARFSLILSKTIKLPVDLSGVVIERIEDVPCHDENGSIIRGEDGELLILTDGTGFISEDLALKCPKNFRSAKFMKDDDFEKICNVVDFEDVPYEGGRVEDWNREPPLLMQCRLFSKGLAVKGTLLVNRKLGAGKIQIRPSMLKVESDTKCTVSPTFDSLEIVAVSHKPRRCYLSKTLIALLSYGGVPRSFFLDILTNALEETQSLFSDMYAALKVAITNREWDDGGTAARMISAGVPLNEPHLQDRLAKLANNERKSLGEGKLPVKESFYLMGTADPTGMLQANEVCVILDNGPVSGKVLVYRNPGLHFGDIHVLKAVYVPELEDIIGNAKFGIFFSTKGQRSAATEIANGDFDGDMYWVSRNPQLLSYFQVSQPWSRMYSTPSALNKKPNEFSAEELEHELFQLCLEKQKPSFNMAMAADSWLAFMDRLLILGNEHANEKDGLIQNMLKLIDIYYDALDAPKSGKKVNVPEDLIAERYPHYMGKGSSYQSTSVLGDIFDKVRQFQAEKRPIGEIKKLPCFSGDIPEEYLNKWKTNYRDYQYEMLEALNKPEDLKNSAADAVIKKYKQLLYEAAELRQSQKDIKEIYKEALAIYHVTYDHAISQRDVSKCGFAWNVAGSALCKLHAIRSCINEDPMLVVPSVLKDVLA